MTLPNKKNPETVFKELSLTYSDTLFFRKNVWKDACQSCWKKTNDPTRKFLFYCHEKALRNKTHPEVYLLATGLRKDYGVFLQEKSLGKHAYVGEYVGIIHKGSVKTFFSRYAVCYPTPFSSFRGFVINAEKTGNFTRFIRHSNSPSVEMKSVLCHEGLLRMIFITKRPLLQNEEITLNYGTWIGNLCQNIW